jgi:hypothetical protein
MKKILFIVSAIAVLTIPTMGQSLTFQIDTLLTGDTPTGSAPWLTLTFTDDGLPPNTVRFTVTSNLQSSSEFISKIVFNVDPLFTPRLINFDVFSKSGEFENPGISKRSQDAQDLNPADNFDIALDFKTAEKKRFNLDDSISYTLSYLDPGGLTLSAESFNFFNTEKQEEYSGFYAVAMFQGSGGKLGDKVETVPEPSTLLLLGAGLVGLGILGRRKFRS